MSALNHRNSKDFKDKNKKANCWKKISGRGGDQIPQHNNRVWSLSEMIENTTF